MTRSTRVAGRLQTYSGSSDRIRDFRTHTEARPPRAAQPQERPTAELTYHIYHSHGPLPRQLGMATARVATAVAVSTQW